MDKTEQIKLLDELFESTTAGSPPADGAPAAPVASQHPAAPTAPVAPSPAPSDDLAALRAELAAMRAEMSQARQPAAPAEPEPTPIQAPGVETFLTQEEFNSALDIDGSIKPAEFMRLMALAAQRSYQLSREHTLRELPEVVTKTAAREATYQTALANFWHQNADLTPFKDQMRLTATRVASENPSFNVNQVLEATAKETRKALEAYNKAAGIVSDPPKLPSFPPAGRSGQRSAGAQPAPSDQQRKVDAILFSNGQN